MSGRAIRGQLRFSTWTQQTAAGNVTVVNEGIVLVNKNSGQATTVNIPAPNSTNARRCILVVDQKGDAAQNKITVVPASGTINGRTNFVIDVPFGAMWFLDNGTEWQTLSPVDPTALTGNRFVLKEDFQADAGATLPKPWGVQDTSSAGSPTLDYIADALNGEFTLLHDNQSEAQNLTLYWADQLMIDPTKRPIFEARLKINFAGATFTADQRIVIGLASARNATLDSVASNVWFRIEGANLNILWESDDGATDDDDNDSGIDIVDNTYTTFRIDMSVLTNIKFYVNGVQAAGTCTTALTAANKLQPFIEIQRDAGAETEQVHIDYVEVEQDRT